MNPAHAHHRRRSADAHLFGRAPDARCQHQRQYDGAGAGHDRSLSGLGPRSHSGRRIARARECRRPSTRWSARSTTSAPDRWPKSPSRRSRCAKTAFPMHPGLCGDGQTWTGIPGLGRGVDSVPTPKCFASDGRLPRASICPDGEVPRSGDIIKNPALANFFPPPARRRSGRPQSAGAKPRCGRASIASIAATSRARSSRMSEAQRRPAGSSEDLAGFTTRIEEPVEPHLSRRHRLQVRAVVAGAGLPATARAAGRLRPRAMGHNSAAYLHHADRGGQARVRRPRGLLRRPRLRRRADQGVVLGRATRRCAAR